MTSRIRTWGEEPPRRHVVIVVANVPAERDARVARQCRALERAGYRITVISPFGMTNEVPGTRHTEVRPYPLPVLGTGTLSFVVEFAWSFVWVTALVVALLWRGSRTGPVAGVQVCNPPDVFWPLALLVRLLRRPFVFDHHDLSPEVYEARTARPNRFVSRVLRMSEWLSLRCASAVIATNDSYRRIAVERAGCRPDRVVVVRNGPASTEVGGDSPEHNRSDPGASTGDGPADGTGDRTDGAEHRIVYLGVIGRQDGVDNAVLAARELVRLRGRRGWRMLIAGDGDELPAVKKLAVQNGLTDVVEFTGWLDPGQIDGFLRSGTVAVQPDLRTGHAEHSTMAKTVEYLARGLPVVAVDLHETRASAGPAALYVEDGTPRQLAAALDTLLDDPDRRRWMGAEARRRYVTALAWEHQVRVYVDLWQGLLARTAAGPLSRTAAGPLTRSAAGPLTRPTSGPLTGPVAPALLAVPVIPTPKTVPAPRRPGRGHPTARPSHQ